MAIGNSCFHAIFRHDDLLKHRIFKQLLSEFLGVFILVFIPFGSYMTATDKHSVFSPSSVHVALCAGMIVTSIILIFHHVSGSQINPAVTGALCVLGYISPLRSILYMIAQCLGSVCAAALLHALLPVGPGALRVNPSIHPVQGLVIEIIITFLLVITIICGVDESRNDITVTDMPAAVGFVVIANVLFAIEWTGASMNPAISFGLSVAAKDWTDHWVYWVGPFIGGFLAAGLFWWALQEEMISLPPRNRGLQSDKDVLPSEKSDHKNPDGTILDSHTTQAASLPSKERMI